MTPPQRRTLKFGIVTDIHYAPEESAAADTTACDLDGCISLWKEAGTDFVVQLGDLISREGPEAETDLLTVSRMLSRYPGPMMHVAGNHCLAVAPERFFRIMGLPAPSYSFAAGGIRFIALHAMDVSVFSEPVNDADRQMLMHYRDELQAPFYCGAVGTRQLEWLVTELDASAGNSEPVIVLSHLPLLEETTDAKHGLLWNHEAVTEILFRYANVRACFSGHYHPGGYALRHGIHFIVVPGFVARNEPPFFHCGTAEISEGRLRIRANDSSVLHDLEFSLQPAPAPPRRCSAGSSASMDAAAPEA
ncbi:MAG: metallophosphoesterase [Chlorobiaceae bacterium]|nr:metallophosphoesterase [Chlorobiaceae bacterium]